MRVCVACWVIGLVVMFADLPLLCVFLVWVFIIGCFGTFAMGCLGFFILSFLVVGYCFMVFTGDWWGYWCLLLLLGLGY